MSLTKTTLPAIAPTQAVPYDTLQAFALNQTLTASGYATNVNEQITQGPGRFYGLWALQISAMAMGSSNEYYQFFLLGSNDSSFGSGNIDVLQMYDFAATAALRDLATICAASPTVPDAGLTASEIVRPWTNQSDQYVFEYMQLYVSMGGTSPSVTFSSWVCPFTAGAKI
jgi:hypothetical protein